MFKKVKSNQSFPKMEEEILKFWEENEIFEKSVERPARNATHSVAGGDYVFYDGPPFATGTPHYGHIVGSVMKDVVPRYWTMKGYRVERKWGWDCHGLPIENIVEKEMGSKTKKEIEELGVEKFNELCRSKVLQYVSEWEKVIKRLGRWADMKNAYKTMDLPFMESVWWVFKELYDRGLVYESYRSMHICPRCETTLSQSEVAEGYKIIKDLSAVVKFELISTNYESDTNVRITNDDARTYILAWTTTPWTLIGNVALAVGGDIDYVKVETQHCCVSTGVAETYILAKERLADIMKDMEYEIVSEFKGSDLVGKKYKPLFDYYSKQEDLKNKENGWKIYAADFVTTDEGTGVVHIAPAFGEDDMNLGKKYNLPFVQHVGMDGIIKKETGDPVSEYGTGFAGVDLKPRAKNKPEEIREADLTVVKFLGDKIFSSEKYEHSYPHCWRCDTPLINYATSSWFVAVTKIKERALELAKNINWTPAHIKEGRFGNWLEGARDWSISRQRFWASVIPIWKCNQEEERSKKKEVRKCNNIKVIGSIKELEELSNQKITDLHKHIVDKITFKCSECGGMMKRIPDVLDTWFDSGSMPYAQMHYPFENKEKFEANFPAEFIAEGDDQCRCWFYYLHVLGTALKDKPAYKNVIVNGIVVGEDGKKLSKRLKNYPDPLAMLEKYGADSLRFYLMSSPVVVAENLNFKESDVADVVRGMMRMLWNSYSFFVLYANIDGWKLQEERNKKKEVSNLLDRWIMSELNVLIKEVDGAMKNYEINKACRLFPKFIDNLSNWYIRRSRKRFWKPARIATQSVAGGVEDDGDKNSAYQSLYYILVELSKLMAPFTPFMAEEIYKNLTGDVDGVETRHASSLQGDDSVHLADFPVAEEKLIDEKLNQEMETARNIITEALQLRAKAGIKVRQPLQEVRIKKKELNDELLEIIKEEVNIKNIIVDENIIESVLLNTEITPELKLEGQAREIIRFIQDMRKEAGYEVDNRIKVCYIGQSVAFEKFGSLIAKETLAAEIKKEKPEEFDLQKTLQVDDKESSIWIKKSLTIK